MEVVKCQVFLSKIHLQGSGPDLELTELSPFSLELVRHEMPVQATTDGCGLNL
jgi:hypothetical protein